ncbi:hypothetical protein QU593_10005 [Rossellomorea marisflavi]|uniref:hypothetical protein n=1 Tax=Rossellomorea marisflavi TaxID=189381 RepID=UPI0025B27F88|nr:hypothetical protein [Rossellomorea marisflavi]WJV20737.1 hypothetical protein QU593_10005 [Rossellomorea marisflavi]
MITKPKNIPSDSIKEWSKEWNRYNNLDPAIRTCEDNINAIKHDMGKVQSSLVKKVLTNELKKWELKLKEEIKNVKFRDGVNTYLRNSR